MSRYPFEIEKDVREYFNTSPSPSYSDQEIRELYREARGMAYDEDIDLNALEAWVQKVLSKKSFVSIFAKRQVESADWSFHGVACSKEQAGKWKALKDAGKCPWCGEMKNSRYGGMDRHLRSCPRKPTNQNS